MDVYVVIESTNDGDVFVPAVFKYERDAILEAKRLIEIEAEDRKQKYFSDGPRTFMLLDNSYAVEVVWRLVRT